MNQSLPSKFFIGMTVCYGLALPSLVLGPVAIGVALFLSLLCFILSSERNLVWHDFVRILQRKAVYVGVGIWLLWLPSVVFSLKPGLSFEAWLRVGLFAFLCGLLGFACSYRKELTLKTFQVSITFFLAIALFSVIFVPEFLMFLRLKGWYFTNVADVLKPAGNALILSVPLSVLAVLYLKTTKWRFLCIINVLLPFAFAFMIHSRATLAGGVLMVLAAFFIILLPIFWRRKPLFIFASLALIISAFPIYDYLEERADHYMPFEKKLAYAPLWIVDLHRQFIWRFSAEKIMQSPWVGYGVNASNYMPEAKNGLAHYLPEGEEPTSFTKSQILPGHPHNWMVEIALDTGLIGFLPLLGALLYALYIASRRYWRTKEAPYLAFISVNAGFWAIGLFNVSFWSSWWQLSFLCLICFCLGMVASQKENA
ncbi:membrane hypothetical protein [Candidatus Terasakiella magnetica]|uniref:O-antigen ligase-related domain-containing protein n=1 Tax=Candidatus Terasakiella magnetica TaxID=1867952 RepID=A0A1C3RG88_9PROT|nr:O-antigen ligase family protein [Candidatus Terasakiella magnetica]SCA56275.1 membrane hypothetical protein [Candidatus Terasakiella magnetica]